jgi:predicted dehydrogenase
MSTLTRRNFILTSLSAGSALMTTPMSAFAKPFSRIIGANDEIRVAVVGLRGKGQHHVEQFHALPGVRVAALCDVDTEILNRELEKFKARNEKVDTYIDVRELLDDKNIDAVIIATPNHWHSLIGIWACQAGKDVYVEKPVSHNIWEGSKLVEAARKYKRIVQAGTQSRSDEGLQEVFDYIQKGNLGQIKVAYGLCYKRRDSIGKVNGPQPIPSSINYDLWTGPAPLIPLGRSRVHYDWHWVWDTGNGDIGNQGVHEMDQCRWVLGQNELPKRVMSFGGRFGYDDDGETANSQIAIFDYEPAPLIFEVQGLPDKKGDTAMGNFKGVRVGLVVICEEGYFAGGGGGGWIYDNQGKKVRQFSGSGGEGHHANFIKAMHSRNVKDLNADILEGHLSSALCHLGNIPYRLGQLSSPEELQETVKSQPEAQKSLDRFRNNLFSNWIDMDKDRATLGPSLEFDIEKNQFIGKGEYSIARWANDLLTRPYREPYVVPENV